MREKLDAAARMPGEPAMFGAGAHGFRLGPPLPESDVAAFEREHGVRLPEDYRAFITTIGNGGPGRWGGAGPYYGLHPLHEWDLGLWNETTPAVLATPFPVEPGHVLGSWVVADDEEPYPGTVALSDQGCGLMSLLVVTGPGRGRIVNTGDGPQPPHFTADEGFLAWYERWLDAVLAGKRLF
ncbi:SMI1/KNR4 family protein [Paractinoplanes atraurantiacus]|uniref:SMI1/KNR4 family protein n=1 Tax=Paractinoplanes atraurantiacus TaxID=1036182 RepID=UPI000BE26E45|nr:SMI1/KNR4 family protein [Actinoplanes atraurantiacus]